MSQKNDAWFQHEGLDRTHMLLVMLEQSLGFYDPDCELSNGEMHPSIWNERCQMALSAATSALADLYQAIGEWEEPAASMQDDSPRMMAIGQNGNTAESYGKGCERKLKEGQWFTYCGETDMGQTLPALCKCCGGEYELAT